MEWSSCGNFLAVGGTQPVESISAVKFYNTNGHLRYTLNIPSQVISLCILREGDVGEREWFERSKVGVTVTENSWQLEGHNLWRVLVQSSFTPPMGI